MAPLALYAWIPAVLCFFAVLRPRHAVLAAYVLGWLFLPIYAQKIPVLPDLDKTTITSMAVFLGVALFDPNCLLAFRPKWFDLPMAAWCAAPFVSSIVNRLGAWDGMSAVIGHVVMWGLPYLIGRLYFADYEGVRELAIAIFVGGLIYVPLCWIEMRFSPQLHRWVYGIRQHSFAQTVRDGGYRPMVFMQHGLAVGMWMALASLVGCWLYVTAALRKLWDVPLPWLLVPLLMTSVMCRSKGATLCLLAGLATLAWIRYVKNAWPLLALIAVAPIYMITRTSGIVSAEAVTSLASSFFPEERVQSLATRVNAEDLLTERAMESRWFGWGRWNPQDPAHPRWRIYNEKGKDIAPTDGMWVIVLGTTGLVGLASLTATILLPALLYRRRVPVGWWAHPLAAPGAVLAVLLPLHMIDNLLNAMINPVFVLAVGGLSAVGAAAVTSAYARTAGDFRLPPMPEPRFTRKPVLP